jgi:hypothetical protein
MESSTAAQIIAQPASLEAAYVLKGLLSGTTLEQ